MIRAVLRIAAVAVVLAAVATPANATPLPIGDCTTSQNVILAVDFSHWGGPVLRSCDTANGTTDTGYQLLNEGGWTSVGDQHDGPAFVCRIGYSGYQNGTRYPTPAQDPCVVTPPANAYWAYWHADPGQNTWTYSANGAKSYRPKPGSVDLWTFGATDIAGTEGRPGVAPDALRAHNTAPIGGAPPPPVATKGNPPPARQPVGVAATPTTHAAVPTTTITTTTTATSSAAVGTTGTSAPPPILDAQPRAAAHQSAGSALPVILGAALVLVLAAGTVVVIRRRRRQQ